MRLHEEYIHRHKLNVPVVRYDSTSQVVLHSKATPLQWRIITCRWRTHGSRPRPGYFEVCCKSPVHNGYYKEHTLIDIISPKSFHWEEYEGGILSIIDHLKMDFEAVKEKESLLAAWQIFIFIYDSWLANNMNYGFMGCVSESVDFDLDLSSRQSAYKKSLSYLKGTEVEDAFTYQIKWWSGCHSKWMEDLING